MVSHCFLPTNNSGRTDLLPRKEYMRLLIVVFAIAALAGCGVETATTAATGAAIKKQEIEEGKKTMGQMQQNIGQAMEQSQQRGEKDGER